MTDREPVDHLRDVLDAVDAILLYTKRAIAGMRDRLAHKYALQDKTLVWAVVEKELPRLRAAMVHIMRRA